MLDFSQVSSSKMMEGLYLWTRACNDSPLAEMLRQFQCKIPRCLEVIFRID